MRCMEVFVTIMAFFLLIVTFPFCLCYISKVVTEYERGVILRLGKVRGEPKGPGIVVVIPCIDIYYVVDLRLITFDVPPQEALTKDAVSVKIDAVVYYKIVNPTDSICNIANYSHATYLLAMTMVRNMIGQKALNEILGGREQMSIELRKTLDQSTARWGIIIERVELKDVALPVMMRRAMAAEAEATQEARAKLIDAEGELKASESLKNAANILNKSPAALQLRFLQTLNTISADRPSTILFPLPIDVTTPFMHAANVPWQK